jgi:hypothetical protein
MTIDPQEVFSELPVMLALQSGWRTEVTRRGGYWQWRVGSGRKRRSRYGGKFVTLPRERQKAYETNKQKRSNPTEHRPG